VQAYIHAIWGGRNTGVVRERMGYKSLLISTLQPDLGICVAAEEPRGLSRAFMGGTWSWWRPKKAAMRPEFGPTGSLQGTDLVLADRR
jgi:hypothetical protein